MLVSISLRSWYPLVSISHLCPLKEQVERQWQPQDHAITGDRGTFGFTYVFVYLCLSALATRRDVESCGPLCRAPYTSEHKKKSIMAYPISPWDQCCYLCHSAVKHTLTVPNPAAFTHLEVKNFWLNFKDPHEQRYSFAGMAPVNNTGSSAFLGLQKLHNGAQWESRWFTSCSNE